MKRFPAFGLLLAGMASSSPAWSQALGISPVLVEMTGDQRAATISVRNTSAALVNFQIRTMDWSQAGGEESLTPSDSLIASPPMATLAPGEEQIVRVMADGLPPLAGEKAFRLIVDELPTADAQAGSGMRLRLRVLIPVFIAPNANGHPAFRWTATRAGSGLVLTAVNGGDKHDRLLNIKVTMGGRTIDVPSANSGYVLAGASQSWTVPGVPPAGQSLKLVADGAFGGVSADVPITP